VYTEELWESIPNAFSLKEGLSMSKETVKKTTAKAAAPKLNKRQLLKKELEEKLAQQFSVMVYSFRVLLTSLLQRLLYSCLLRELIKSEESAKKKRKWHHQQQRFVLSVRVKLLLTQQSAATVHLMLNKVTL
jgi:hypothetical protein